MNSLIYDTTFSGFLTAIFEIYEYKFIHPTIYKEGEALPSLFGKVHTVHTNAYKAKRVFEKLYRIGSVEGMSHIHAAFLSEETGIENTLCRYIKYVIQTGKNVEDDYSNKDVLSVQQTAKRVFHEAHRFTGFVRFQQAGDGLYFSIIEPDHNILPLITQHFKDRFADQRWLIYDAKRKYGIYYDLINVIEVSLHAETNTNQVGFALHEDEALYQQLWKKYFKTTYNASRKNTKLHVQLLPKRYWKHLTEKF